jgi:hypothetical protein
MSTNVKVSHSAILKPRLLSTGANITEFEAWENKGKESAKYRKSKTNICYYFS